MNIELTSVGGCKRNLIVEIPSEVAQQEFDKISQKYAKMAMVPGFRPGKAPVSIIRRRFYKEIKGEVIKESIDKYFKEALESKKLKPISEPEFNKIDFEVGSPLKFDVTFEIMPEINITDYKGLQISIKKSPEITDNQVDEVIKRRQEEAATFVPIKRRATRKGDLVTIDLTSTQDTKEDAVAEKGISFEIDPKRYDAPFTRQLVGLKAGGQKTFSIDYEESYPDKRFAGKKIHHSIEVVEAKEKILPEINDEFARDLGDYADLKQLRDSIKKNLEAISKRREEEQAKDELLKILRERNPMEVPEVLVNQQLGAIIKDLSLNLSVQGIDLRKTKIDWEKVVHENKPRALVDVQNLLILDHISKKENFETSQEETDAELERIAKGSGLSVDAVRAKYQKEDGLQPLKDSLRFKKALDFVHKHAKIITED